MRKKERGSDGISESNILYCDGNEADCETVDKEASSAEKGVITIAQYRHEMKGSGWVFTKDNKAYCPVCRKHLH